MNQTSLESSGIETRVVAYRKVVYGAIGTGTLIAWLCDLQPWLAAGLFFWTMASSEVGIDELRSGSGRGLPHQIGSVLTALMLFGIGVWFFAGVLR